MNVTMLIGRLVKDAELKYTEGSGVAVSKITLAVDNYNSKTGEEGADFIPVVVFGKRAETIAQYVDKGNQVAIAGHIHTGSYEDKEGAKKYATDFIVEEAYFADSRKETEDEDFITVDDTDDLPF